jgi:mannose-1-phosphate guanylyltransferase
MDSNFKNLSVLLLAAGVGSRLMPLTNSWPKCLMPIGKKPLLEYWLSIFYKLDINKVMVNLHYQSEIVESFLQRDRFKDWVSSDFEPILLGTAGTLKKNMPFFFK